MGGEQRCHAFVGKGLDIGAPRVAQCHHEKVDAYSLGVELKSGFSPIDLGLLSRRSLVAALCEISQRGLQAQGPHRKLHRVIAALVTALSQFLKQDPCGVAHLRRPVLEPGLMRCQQRRDRWLASVWPPLALVQPVPYRLAVQVQGARNRGN